jgi:Zn-dependent protease
MSDTGKTFCANCGKEITFASNYCPYCGSQLSFTAPPGSEQPARWDYSSYSSSSPPSEDEYARTRQSSSFSRIEIRDIVIAWIALSAAFTLGITGGVLGGFNSRLELTVSGSPVYLTLEVTFFLALITIGVGFLLHELMHKFIAERYGFKAEFRMWLSGLAFALFSALFLGVVFAAPGATYIMGQGISKRENGIISLAGPLTNIVIALIFLPLLLANSGRAIIQEAGYLGSYFNFFLAAFNMLPIFVLDGTKVWRWNKLYWAAVFIPLAIIVLAFLTGYFP